MLGPLESELLMRDEFAGYTRHFFTIHKEKLPAGWQVDDAQMADFRTWLQQKRVDFDDADFMKESAEIRRSLQENIYKTAFSVDASTQYELQTDPEVLAAAAAMPKAMALLQNVNKIRAARAQK
jgi:hypothetical protein